MDRTEDKKSLPQVDFSFVVILIVRLWDHQFSPELGGKGVNWDTRI